MTQEDKELLLKDICGRLWTLNLWVQYKGEKYIVSGYGHGRVSLLTNIFSSITADAPLIEEVKPYLRPMSSMTEDEKNECKDYLHSIEGALIGNIGRTIWLIDWLNKNMFDYRGLIPKGLALEAPSDMYKEE